MPTLVERAKKVKIYRKAKRKYSQQDFDLIDSWLDDEITMAQAAKTLEFGNDNQFLCYAAYGIREMARRGIK